jgi:hypothetical protein
LVERARRATEMRVRRRGERREEEERVLESRRVEEQQRGERGVRAERRRGGALAGGKRWVSEGGGGVGWGWRGWGRVECCVGRKGGGLGGGGAAAEGAASDWRLQEGVRRGACGGRGDDC